CRVSLGSACSCRFNTASVNVVRITALRGDGVERISLLPLDFEKSSATGNRRCGSRTSSTSISGIKDGATADAAVMGGTDGGSVDMISAVDVVGREGCGRN